MLRPLTLLGPSWKLRSQTPIVALAHYFGTIFVCDPTLQTSCAPLLQAKADWLSVRYVLSHRSRVFAMSVQRVNVVTMELVSPVLD